MITHNDSGMASGETAAKRSRRRLWLATSMLAMVSAYSAKAQAPVLPSEGQIIAGQAVISQPTAQSLLVSQTSNKAIIDWKTFSIGQNGSVHFDNGDGATLNRVTGTSMSSIDGLLSATGSVYLINPNGVIIGKNGVVKVGGSFAASTLNLGNSEFLKGSDLTFDGLSGASVVNLGKIGALGGNVSLIANTVSNAGDISASKGTVGLIAAQSVLLRDQSVDGGKFLILRGGAGSSVNHTGTIAATAAELRAEGGSVYALAGNTSNVERATDVVESDGKLYLAVAGSQSGGHIDVTGDITATKASGDGGTIIAMADMTSGTLNFQGHAIARGANGQNGGFVETSGAHVNFTGASVDTSAAGGKTGQWLVDPFDLTVDAAGAGTISSNLATTNVTLQTTASGTSGPGVASAGNGDITINSAIGWASSNTLTLDAYHSININAALTISGGGGVNLITNNGGTGGDYSFNLGASGFAGKIAFTGTPGSGQSLSINGTAYSLLYSMSDIVGLNNGTGHYALANSLDASAITYADSLTTNFGGTFTGLGNTIAGLTINGTNYETTGLFARSSGTLRDIGLTGGSVTGAAHSKFTGALVAVNTGVVKNAYASTSVDGGLESLWVGGLIGSSENGAVSNVYATGTVSGAFEVGGLLGRVDGGSVSDAYATGNVNGNTGVTSGGLIGRATGAVIDNVHATGNVNSGISSRYAGGLIGQMDGGSSLSNAYATGTVTGGIHAAGLVAYVDASSISHAFATGGVSGKYYIGGFVGEAHNSTIDTAFSTGSITLGEGDIGGFAGVIGGTTITNAYTTGSVTAVGDYGYDFGAMIGRVDAGSNVSNAYATGLLDAGDHSTHVNGFAGIVDPAATLSNAYYDYQTTGKAAGTQADGSQGLSTAALQGTLPAGFSNAIWGTAAGYYPFLSAYAPVQRISGFAYNANGSAASGGTVGVYTGGALLNGATVTTGANGYYYYTVNLGTADASTKLGASLTLNGATHISGLTYTDAPTVSGNDITGLDITSGLVSIRTMATAYSAAMSHVISTFGVSNYASVSADLATANKRLIAATGFTIDQSISDNGKLLIQANDGDVTLASGVVVQSNATGDAVTLAANGSFINNAGTSGVAASNGRWLIYSQTHNNAGALPTGNVTGGLSGTSYYNDAFNLTTGAFASAANSGNRFVYGYAPTLTLTPDTLNRVYNGAAQTGTYGITGHLSAADQGSDVLSGTLSGLTTSAKDVGAYTLTASGTLVSDQNYAIAYGSGTLTITPASLTASLIGNTTKTYDGTTAASLTSGNYSLTGLFGTDAVGATSTSAAYDDKNVGSDKTVTASGLALTGTDAGNYTVNATASGLIGDITPASLTASLTGNTTKTYDGTLTASLTTGNYSLGGIIGTDNVALNAPTSGAYGDKNVGSGKNVTASGLALTGTDAGNYTVNASASGLIGDITPAALTASLIGNTTKTYDSTTVASLTSGNYSLSGLFGTDAVGVSATLASYDNKNVGTGKTVTASGLTLTGTDAGNYTVNSLAFANIGAITPATLTAGLTGNTTKSYDSTTAASLASGNYALGGILGTDNVALNAPTSGTFDNKNAGTGKTVTATGIALTGTDAGNYTVNASASGTIGTITPAALTASLIGNTTKTYDGTTTATLGTANVSLSGVIGTDSVALTSAQASYDNKNVGSGKTVTVNGLTLNGTDAGNYTLGATTSGAIGTITPASLTASLTGSTVKTYDSTTTANLTSGNYALGGVFGTDNVALNSPTTGTYDSKNAGTGKTVTATGLTLGGTDAGNYTVNASASGAIGTITPAALTASLTGNTTKTYDGTTAATLGASNVTLSGVIGADQISLTSAQATYENKNVGTGKTVTVTGLTLNGIDAGNYSLGTTASGAIGSITPATLTAGLTGNTTKTYDATTAATLTTGNYSLTGVFGTDSVNVAASSAAYANKNAGTGKIVTATGLILSGTDAGNYIVNTSASGAIGTITPAALTAGLTGNTTKTYNGTTAAALTSGNYTLSGLIGTDAVNVAGTSAAYANKNAGTGKTVTATGLTLSGTDAGNYTVNTSASGAIGTITPVALTAGLTGNTTKTYDGTTTATLTSGNYTLSGAVSGDTVALNAPTSGAYANKNAGTGKTVTATGLALNGTDAGNYTVNNSASGAIGTITPATLTASLTGNAAKTYDGTTTATLNASNVILNGLIGTDAVSVASASAAYADKNAGTGKTVTATGFTLSGADAGNYTVTNTASGAIGTINRAALTVRGDDISKVYSLNDPALTYHLTAGSLFGSDTLTGQVTRTSGETPGNYDITQGTLAASSNYTLTYINGVFTITPSISLSLTTFALPTPSALTPNEAIPTAPPQTGTVCASYEACPDLPYPTNQVLSSTVRFVSQ